jgi:DNA-binding LytR/AlgR family response regulator
MIIAICDDDKKANEKMRTIVESYMRIKELEKFKIQEYPSGDALILDFTSGKFDIIFLDIEMPGTDGFSTAQKVRELDLDVDIIFITHLRESVQRGFDYNAKGYLYKGVTEKQIHEKIDKLVNERLRSKEDALLKVKLVKGASVLLSLARVQYFESSGHYISAVTETESTEFIATISDLAKELESKGFIRASRSHIVNVNYIFSLTGNKLTIKKGEDITVGRTYKQSINKTLEKRVIDKWKI